MANYQGNDIYCDLIIPGKIDIEIVKETDTVLAFHHTKPYWPTHIVVVPKQHINSFVTLDLDSEISKELLQTVQEVTAMITQRTGSCRVLTNLGSYQDSKHLHIHVSSGDPLRKK